MSFAFVSESQLDNWVRSHSVEARSLIPTMISQLVAKSCPNASQRRFLSGDSIDQLGVDGFLRDENGFPPFVPSGDSYWEIGIGPAARKATNDYEKRTRDIPANVRHNSTLVIVNPRSSVKEWRNARKGEARNSWTENREKRKEWKAIKLIDGTIIADWLIKHPDVGRWVAENIVGLPKHHIETVDQHWKLLQSYGSPNLLTPELFLGNRINAIQHLKELLYGDANELKLLTRFPDQVSDFVCAFIASLEEEDRIRFSSRALIISDPKAWYALCDIYEGTRLILIADSSLDLSGESTSRMIQKALVSGHSAIYDAPYGGPIEDLTLRLQDPRINDIYRALTSVGYFDHQAHDITNKSGRNLNQVLRMLRNDTPQPNWASGEGSGDLIFALLAGAWQHNSQAEREIIQRLTGKNYIEWTRTVRKAAGFRNPPVVDRNGWWKFIPRFEGWHSLGRILDEEHLLRLHEVVTMTLRSHIVHSKLADAESSRTSLEANEFKVSSELKKGLSESLALMGSFPDVSDLLTQKEIEEFVGRTVKHVLSNFDGEDWLTLHELLPFLAEASPIDFLNSILESLEQHNSLRTSLALPATVFDSTFAFPHGLIWAIESIAWNEEYLPLACKLLGKLAELVKEPEKGNQPLQSLVRILFPLMPQTNASSQHRMDVVRVLLQDTPVAGWNLLHELFPNLSGTVTVNYRPVWRKLFPDNWEPAISSQRDFIYQIETLSDLAVDLASEDYEKLNDERFIELFPDLSPSAFKRIMCHLSSDSIIEKPDDERLDLWKHLALATQKA